MSLYATAGTKLFIGTVLPQKNVDFVLADFASIDFEEITSIESLGSLGDTSQSVTFAAIGEAREKVLKGTRSASAMEVVCGVDVTDLGQIACIAAERSPEDFAFKIELNDKPATGGSPKPSIRYFIAKVMSQQEVYDTANSVRKINFTLAVNSNIVRTVASAT